MEELDESYLEGLLDKFDDQQKTLANRLQSLRGTTVPKEREMAPPQEADESGPET